MAIDFTFRHSTYLCSPVISSETKTVQFFENRTEGSEGHLKDPLHDRPRAVIDLQHVSSEDYPLVLDSLKIHSSAALSTLNTLLEKEDAGLGTQKLEHYKQKGLITVERIGFSKSEEAKFYLMINHPIAKGRSNQFHYGISRKGTLRTVKRSFCGKNWQEERAIGYAKEIHKKLGKHSSISRIMNQEGNTVVSELADEPLTQLYISRLTQKEKLIIYWDLIEGVSKLRENSLVHSNLKSDSVAVRRDSTGSIVGVKIIGLKNLAKNQQDLVIGGTLRMLSPERLVESWHRSDLHHLTTYLANSKEDLWAVMLIICEMEIKAYPSNRLLSDAVIGRYIEFENSFFDADNIDSQNNTEQFLQRLKWIKNNLEAAGRETLFEGIELITPLDILLNSIASLDPVSRIPAHQLIPLRSLQSDQIKEDLAKLQLRRTFQRIIHQTPFFQKSEEDYVAAGLDFTRCYDLCVLLKQEDPWLFKRIKPKLQKLTTTKNQQHKIFSSMLKDRIKLINTGLKLLRTFPLDHPIRLEVPSEIALQDMIDNLQHTLSML